MNQLPFTVSDCFVLLNRGHGNQEISVRQDEDQLRSILLLLLKSEVIHHISRLKTMPLAGLDEEHLGLPKQSRAVFSVES